MCERHTCRLPYNQMVIPSTGTTFAVLCFEMFTRNFHRWFFFCLTTKLTFQKCCGPVTFWYGSGSETSDPYLYLRDPDADPGGPKTYASGSGTQVKSLKEVTEQ